MEHVYLQTNGKQITAFADSLDALNPFITTRGDWQVYLNDTDTVVPVIPENVSAIRRNIEQFGYVAFRQVEGRIMKVPFQGERRKTSRERTCGGSADGV